MSLQHRFFAQPRMAPLLAVGVPAAFYLATLYPGPGGRFNAGDSLKYQYIGEVLGVPHAPGNPQYVVLNWLWTRLPLPGSLADRVNLMSMFFSLVALATVFLLARRLSSSDTAAVLGTWTMAFARRYWMVSTEAEVYSLSLAWVGALLLSAVAWRSSRDDRWLLTMIICYALSFGNHASMITFLPALVFLVLFTRPSVLCDPKWIAVGSASIAAGIAQYGFVYWRAHTPADTYLEGIVAGASFGDLIDTMLARQHLGEFDLSVGWNEILHRRTGEVLGELAANVLYPALGLAAVGGWILWRRDRVLTTFLALSGLGVATIATLSRAGDWPSYLLPVLPIVAILVAIALGASLSEQPPLRSAATWAIVLPLGVIVPLNIAALHLDETRFDLSYLIGAAEPPAIVVHPQENYIAAQLENYYRYSLGADGVTGIEVIGIEGLADGRLVLDDRRLFFADFRVRNALWGWQTDIVERASGRNLGDWIRSLPPRSHAAVIAADLPQTAVREQLAGALRSLGLGGALLADRSHRHYAGFGTNSPPAGIEVTGIDEAVLGLEPHEAAAIGIEADAPITLAAGRARGGLGIEAHVGGRRQQFVRPGLHALAFVPGEPDPRGFYVDARAGMGGEPRYLTSATNDPVRLVRLMLAGAGQRPALMRTLQSGSAPLNLGSLPIELVVVSDSDLRVKGSFRYDENGSRAGAAGLVEIAGAVPPGDWVFVVLDTPLRADVRPMVEAAIVALGLPVPALDSIDGYCVVFGRARTPGPWMAVGPADGEVLFRLAASAEGL